MCDKLLYTCEIPCMQIALEEHRNGIFTSKITSKITQNEGSLGSVEILYNHPKFTIKFTVELIKASITGILCN